MTKSGSVVVIQYNWEENIRYVRNYNKSRYNLFLLLIYSSKIIEMK